MSTVSQVIDRLRAVGHGTSKIVVWRDQCRRSITASCVEWDFADNHVTLDLSVNDGTRDELISALESQHDQHADVVIWISGCLRTVGEVEYDASDDTITVKTTVV